MNSIFHQVRKNTMAVSALTLLIVVYLAGVVPAQAQTFTTLYNFQGYSGSPCNPCDGAYPHGLVQGANGLLYGTTASGGMTDEGSIFEIKPSGSGYKLVWSFADKQVNGYSPQAPLTLATNGNFYGTTIGTPGGGSGDGTDGVVFKMTLAGKVTVLYKFCSKTDPNGDCLDGITPTSPLIEASNGKLYGTTSQGGAYAAGTIFEMTLAGKFTSLYTFCATRTQNNYCSDGSTPYAGLVQGSDGSLYGMTTLGGPNNGGTVFKISESGAFDTIYNFCSLPSCTDGWNPTSALVVGPEGNLYGTTSYGGSVGYGTFFTITSSGNLTTLYNFCSQPACADGGFPQAFILGSDGNFYGVTSTGGLNYGTIFQMTPAGTPTTVHSFDQPVNEDGYGNGTLLVQDTNGTFYGTSFEGGNVPSGPYGTVFSLSTGLGPFVQLLPAAGKVGASITILGTSLKGATSVSFNGTPASFKVASATKITATVPTGATNGNVTVATPSGTLTSNVPFSVTP